MNIQVIEIDCESVDGADFAYYSGLHTGVLSGQNGVFVFDLAAGSIHGPYFYTIAELDSANVILTVPLSALQIAAGLKLTVSTPFSFFVLAFDNHYTGNLTYAIGPMAYELDMPQFYAGSSEFSVPAGGSLGLTIFPNNAANPYFSGPYNGNSPSQTGLLFMYTDGKLAREFDGVAVTP